MQSLDEQIKWKNYLCRLRSQQPPNLTSEKQNYLQSDWMTEKDRTFVQKRGTVWANSLFQGPIAICECGVGY